MQETPTISSSSYTTSALNMAQAVGLRGMGGMDGRDGNQGPPGIDSTMGVVTVASGFMKDMENPINNIFNVVAKMEKVNMGARIVKVFIVDPNESIPLDKRMLYSGSEKLTDLTDTELFFEIPIAELLAKHNAMRKATLDKAQTDKFGREIFLESARIRDLKMNVTTVAQF